jgi:hypothetical protein
LHRANVGNQRRALARVRAGLRNQVSTLRSPNHLLRDND